MLNHLRFQENTIESEEHEVKCKMNEQDKIKQKRQFMKENKKPNEEKIRRSCLKQKVSKKKKITKTCSLCLDDLISDAEEEAEKNIGCDLCPRWFHLSCTELSALTYSEAADRAYKCNFC